MPSPTTNTNNAWPEYGLIRLLAHRYDTDSPREMTRVVDVSVLRGRLDPESIEDSWPLMESVLPPHADTMLSEYGRKESVQCVACGDSKPFPQDELSVASFDTFQYHESHVLLTRYCWPFCNNVKGNGCQKMAIKLKKELSEAKKRDSAVSKHPPRSGKEPEPEPALLHLQGPSQLAGVPIAPQNPGILAKTSNAALAAKWPCTAAKHVKRSTGPSIADFVTASFVRQGPKTRLNTFSYAGMKIGLEKEKKGIWV